MLLVNVAEHLQQRIRVVSGDCWEWTLGTDKDGYATSDIARQYFDGTNRVHRILYSLLVAPIPPGLELDHTCKNRLCVNPEHMEPVTRKVNAERSGNAKREQTHCVRGHEFTAENTYIFPPSSSHAGQRLCKECNRIRTRRNSGGRWSA